MGHAVLSERFFQPWWETTSAITACMRGHDGCSWPQVPAMTSGSTLLHAAMISIVFVAVPLYVIGLASLLLFHGKYRRAEVDEKLAQLQKDKRREIEHWCKERCAALLPKDDLVNER